MPLSPELDTNVRKSFEELIASGKYIIEDMNSSGAVAVWATSHNSRYKALRQSSSSIVRIVLGETEQALDFNKKSAHLRRTSILWKPL